MTSGRRIEYKYIIKGQEFNGIQAAAEAFDVNKSTIGRWVKSKKKADCYREKSAAHPEEITEQAEADDLTPLDFMLKVMRDKTVDIRVRSDMAKSAAPYVHEKVTQTGKKVEKSKKSKEASHGKFSAGRAPLKAVK